MKGLSSRHLVLGGLGFIGRHVALTLARQGAHVVIADRVLPSEELRLELEAAAGTSIAIRRLEFASADWADELADIDVVHHYSWATIPQTANEDPIRDLEENVRSTVRLLEEMRRHEHIRLVFASSGGTVYGRLLQIPVPETHPLEPITAYGVSKAAVEHYLSFYRGCYGLDCRVARISNPFGAGQDPRRLQGAASAFVFKALANEEITIWGDGSVVRDYIHITDLAEALTELSLASRADCGNPPVFNIGSGEGAALNDILEALSDRLGCSLRVSYLPGRPFDIPISILDIERIRARLNWKPKLVLSEGLNRMISDIEAGATRLSRFD